MLTVKGILIHITHIGSETTGCVIDLDKELTLDNGDVVGQIEVNPLDKKIDDFEGVRVEVTGEIVWEFGIERGSYPVIEIETIRSLSE